MSFSQKEIEEHEHYESYYFCNIVNNVLNDQGSYLRNLNDYYGDGRSSAFNLTFPKWSHFHDFIEFIIKGVYLEDLSDSRLEERLTAFKYHVDSFGIKPNGVLVSFANMKELYSQYLSKMNMTLSKSSVVELEGFLTELYESPEFAMYIEKTVKEVFYILFGNRSVLQLYNIMIAEAREMDWDPGDYDKKVNTLKGYLKRLAIPKWVQKAVYHRDKGRCVMCKKDLTGLVNIYNKSNYDHIVPLARFGINDVSNIQLLCESCNQRKKAKNDQSSNDYFPWYLI